MKCYARSQQARSNSHSMWASHSMQMISPHAIMQRSVSNKNLVFILDTVTPKEAMFQLTGTSLIAEDGNDIRSLTWEGNAAIL